VIAKLPVVAVIDAWSSAVLITRETRNLVEETSIEARRHAGGFCGRASGWMYP
jgi:hypothetical protein